MNKIKRKLVLRPETLRTLRPVDLRDVCGGVDGGTRDEAGGCPFVAQLVVATAAPCAK
jgi:hypothetical protein